MSTPGDDKGKIPPNPPLEKGGIGAAEEAAGVKIKSTKPPLEPKLDEDREKPGEPKPEDETPGFKITGQPGVSPSLTAGTTGAVPQKKPKARVTGDTDTTPVPPSLTAGGGPKATDDESIEAATTAQQPSDTVSTPKRTTDKEMTPEERALYQKWLLSWGELMQQTMSGIGKLAGNTLTTATKTAKGLVGGSLKYMGGVITGNEQWRNEGKKSFWGAFNVSEIISNITTGDPLKKSPKEETKKPEVPDLSPKEPTGKSSLGKTESTPEKPEESQQSNQLSEVEKATQDRRENGSKLAGDDAKRMTPKHDSEKEQALATPLIKPDKGPEIPAQEEAEKVQEEQETPDREGPGGP